MEPVSKHCDRVSKPQKSCRLKLDQTSWTRLALQMDPVLQEPWIQVNEQRTRMHKEESENKRCRIS